MNCVKCGNPLPEGTKFCGSCGMPVPVEPQPKPVRVVIPYEPPKMEGGNIIIPLQHRYRILCPDCGRVSDTLKWDQSAGYPCPVCGKAYSYAGQLLLYKIPSFYPLHTVHKIFIMIDGLEYGELLDREPTRVMLSPGTHMVTVRGNGISRPMQYQINVSPEYNTFAFKFQLIYTGPFTYPGKGTSNEFKPCAPEDIPNI